MNCPFCGKKLKQTGRNVFELMRKITTIQYLCMTCDYGISLTIGEKFEHDENFLEEYDLVKVGT